MISRAGALTSATLLAALGLAACDGAAAPACATRGAIVNGSSDVPAALGAAAASVVGIRLASRLGDQVFEETCSGAWVDARHVVTAAHCSDGDATFELRLLAGPAAPPIDDCGGAVAGEATLPGAAMHVHPAADVAVIDVLAAADGGVLATETPVCDALPAVGARAFVAGFGLTEAGVLGERRYLETFVTRVADDAIDVQSPVEAGACVGDSGGPLFIEQAGAWCVAGSLSAGSASCRGRDRYVPLSALRDWITAS
jgi:hypothetical protein